MILMSGVTGRIGRWLPAVLRERDVPVRAIARDPVAARELLGPGLAEAELFQGDALDPRPGRARWMASIGSTSASCARSCARA